MSGNLNATANGSITQANAISVAGTSSFNAGANAIDLSTNGSANNFVGAVSLNNSGSNNVSLTNKHRQVNRRLQLLLVATCR